VNSFFKKYFIDYWIFLLPLPIVGQYMAGSAVADAGFITGVTFALCALV
jgi:hypothetical protein